MFEMRKSAVFMQQWRSYAQGYKDRAGQEVAERFVTAVEDALRFIQQSPRACALYDTGEGYEDLRAYQFQKWSLRGFPHVVLFRMGDASTIFVEVLYAHRMDIASRLSTDKDAL